MTESEPNQSARILGQDHGLTAFEMNFLLKEAGFLDGEPGMYTVTEKGRLYANEQHHSRGTGGHTQYNPHWDTRTWDPSIKRELHITSERMQQIREAARGARQLKAASRPIHEADFDRLSIGGSEANGSVLRSVVVVAGGLAIGALSIYGYKKVAPRLKTMRIDMAARRSGKLQNQIAGGTETGSEKSDSEVDPST